MGRTVFGVFVFSTIITLGRSTCTGGPYLVEPTMPGQILTSYPHGVFKTFQYKGHNECFDECIRRASCKSYHYTKSLYLCELTSDVGYVDDDFRNDTDIEYTSMEGIKNTIYDPCPDVPDCYPGTVCITYVNGTKECIIEDTNAYQAHLDSVTVPITKIATTENEPITTNMDSAIPDVNGTTTAAANMDVIDTTTYTGNTDVLTTTTDTGNTDVLTTTTDTGDTDVLTTTKKRPG